MSACVSPVITQKNQWRSSVTLTFSLKRVDAPFCLASCKEPELSGYVQREENDLCVCLDIEKEEAADEFKIEENSLQIHRTAAPETCSKSVRRSSDDLSTC